jgi:hypothetical protein
VSDSESESLGVSDTVWFGHGVAQISTMKIVQPV